MFCSLIFVLVVRRRFRVTDVDSCVVLVLIRVAGDGCDAIDDDDDDGILLLLDCISFGLRCISDTRLSSLLTRKFACGGN